MKNRNGIRDVARKSGVNKKDVKKVFNAIKEMLIAGKSVSIINFGSFKKEEVKIREFKIPSGKVVYGKPFKIKFKLSPKFRDEIND